MKIEVDTREESPAGLRRLARFLNELAGSDAASSTPSEASSGASADSFDESALPAAFGMFDEDATDDDEVGDAPVERADAEDGFRVVPY